VVDHSTTTLRDGVKMAAQAVEPISQIIAACCTQATDSLIAYP
jgi:hypothetical protein